MSKVKFSLKPVMRKPSRKYKKGSKYDPILEAFMASTDKLVKVTVEGKNAHYLRSQLNKRIEEKGITNVKVSVVNNVAYLEAKGPISPPDRPAGRMMK